MDDCYRRLSILLKFYLTYIKIKLMINSRRDTMCTYILSNELTVKKMEEYFNKEGYYISNYRPHVYLIHPILYED